MKANDEWWEMENANNIELFSFQGKLSERYQDSLIEI